jgi:dipeptidyl-peptidase-4
MAGLALIIFRKTDIIKKFITMKNKILSSIILLLFILPIPLFSQSQTKDIELADIYRYFRFFPMGTENLNSMNDGEHFTQEKEGRRIEKYSYKTGEYIEALFDLSLQKELPFRIFTEYSFSADEKKILLTTNKEKIYRHSFAAEYYIYDTETNALYPLSENGKQQLATFSPDGSQIAFVRENNLYTFDLYKGIEKQITTDGKHNFIINGAPDWVYEEEFAFSKAFAWSPDNRRIAFYRFDEERVKQFNMTMYNELYPDWYQFKYPKAGEENSIVSIHIYDIASGKINMVDIGEETDQYIPRIKWTNDPAVLSIIRLNRLQNKLEILHANALNGKTKVVYEEREEKYISEPTDDMITYLPNNEEFVIKSERDNWLHFYLYNFKTGIISPITKGDFDIDEMLGIDFKKGILYYSSSEESVINHAVYSIDLDGSNKKLLTPEKGWNIVEFSIGFKYYINNYSNINSPGEIGLYNIKGKKIRVLQDHTALKNRLKEYGFSQAEYFSFITSEDVSLNGYMIKPPNFDPSKKYPLFMFAYGGPESNRTENQYNGFYRPWFEMLAHRGYVVVCVDNRGTDCRGEEFRKSTYMELGKLETIDQLEVAKYMGSQPYIDESRIGMFGWSYGGFLSLSCLFKGDGLLKMAIAVAPVTNWRFYDTVYTERFMRKPQDNPDGYDENSPINFTKDMKGKLLLVHGMGDDNVHFQNSAELMKSLVDADKQFESQFYPNKNHGIYGGNTTYHLFSRMTNFINDNL